MKVRSLAAWLCAGLSMLGPAVARALPAPADDAATDPAKAAYRSGVEHFKQKRWGDAIVEFNKAYRLDPNPVLVFNMARAFEEMKDYASAVEFYRKYLEMAPKADDRDKVEASIRTLEILQKQTRATVSVSVRSNPDGAAVYLDGRQAGVTPLKTELPAGTHYLAVEKDGFVRVSKELALVEQPLEETVTLLPAPPGSAPVAAPVVEGDSTRTWAWICIGTGGALLAGGGIAGYQALRKSQKLDEIDENPAGHTQQTYEDLKSSGRTFALVADGLFVTGAAAAITGTILLLTADDEPTREGEVAPVAGIGSLGLSVAF